LTGTSQHPDLSCYSIIGRSVALGPLRRELLPLYEEWRGDFSALRPLSDLSDPSEFDEADTWFDDLTTSDEHSWFTIYDLGAGKPIGITGLIDIDYDDRTAEFFLHIGEVAQQSLEFGDEASRLLRDYAFTGLGLTSLFSMAYEYNLSELRYCETAGFREFTRQRRAHLVGGRLWDVIYLECLAIELPRTGVHGRGLEQPYH
jgi:RimJ/RimL family protein N-acetyltransferase